MGLNSTWGHFADRRRGKLPLGCAQFHELFSDHRPLRELDAERALLLMHHPEDWFHPDARKMLLRDIYRPRRFDAMLFGHMHQPQTERRSVGGGPDRLRIQAASLLGLAHYGKSNEARILGFSFGEIRDDEQIRFWPMLQVERLGGIREFDRDPDFDGSDEDGVVLRPAAASGGTGC